MKRSAWVMGAVATALAFASAVPVDAAWNGDHRGTVKVRNDSPGFDSDRRESGWGRTGWRSEAHAGRRAGTSDYGTRRGGTTVPEPSNVLMLVLGLAGLIAGRIAARRGKKL